MRGRRGPMPNGGTSTAVVGPSPGPATDGSTADITGNASPNVRFFDLAGTTGCSPAPIECNALRTIALPASAFVFLNGPAIAFGRIAIGSNNVGRTGTTTVFGLPG